MENETKNQPDAPAQGPSVSSVIKATPGQGEPSKPEPQVENQEPFFDVMPKNRAQGPLVSAERVPVESNAPEPKESFVEKLAKNKKIIIFVLIGLGLAVGAYVAIQFIFSKPASEELVVPQSTSEESEEELEEISGVTTPREWRAQYFSGESCEELTECGDEADPDRDGLKNSEEYTYNTDPNNKDSDSDKIADGDEVHVFATNPAEARTANDSAYDDADYISGGYNVQTGVQLTPDQVTAINMKMTEYGLHDPTYERLGSSLQTLYHFTIPAQTPSQATSTEPSSYDGDQSPQAKQDRDTQRNTTIKTIGTLLIRYYEDNREYPLTENFNEMIDSIKPYNRVALRSTDPINQDPFVYTYSPSADGQDFTLTFYSETQNQLIKVTAEDAAKFKAEQEGAALDEQRKTDMEMIRSALLLYSNSNASGNQEYVFPTESKYKTALVPAYLSAVPKDPKFGTEYEYDVSATFDAFTLKSPLNSPPMGNTGYLCNADECRYY